MSCVVFCFFVVSRCVGCLFVVLMSVSFFCARLVVFVCFYCFLLFVCVVLRFLFFAVFL